MWGPYRPHPSELGIWLPALVLARTEKGGRRQGDLQRLPPGSTAASPHFHAERTACGCLEGSAILESRSELLDDKIPACPLWNAPRVGVAGV